VGAGYVGGEIQRQDIGVLFLLEMPSKKFRMGIMERKPSLAVLEKLDKWIRGNLTNPSLCVKDKGRDGASKAHSLGEFS